MPEAAPSGIPFFVAGGTLSAEAGSYVEREADSQLFDALSAGKFCYVLNSRQMGKSSICVRTMRRLESKGVRNAFVDLTKIGGKNVTPEQWYAGIAVEIGRALELRSEILAYWKENAELSSVQRLFGALREVVLARIAGPVVVYFDEVDATRSLQFSADEFFAAIRESFNRRVQDHALDRLSFCLLGVAIPSDLINSPTSTPFNVGERIYLRDFTLGEASRLASGLGSGRSEEANLELLQRVFYWTNGHPYLTQTLCMAIAGDASIQSVADVDSLVGRRLLDPKSRETNINLADVGNRALHSGDSEQDPEKFRADLLSAYERALKGKPLPDDESNRVAALLKLSGLMRPEGKRLVVRNRIYRHVFDEGWIRENMPGQELRRQQRSYWMGVIRTAVVGGLVIALVSGLAVYDRRLAAMNARLAQIAEQERANAEKAEIVAEYHAYAADVNSMRLADVDKNYTELAKLLGDTKGSRFRGVEWDYWNGQIHDARSESEFPPDVRSMTLAPDGKSIALTDSITRECRIFTYPGLERVSDVPLGAGGSEVSFLFGRWVQWIDRSLREVRFDDAISGQTLGIASFRSGGIFGASIAQDCSALAISWGELGRIIPTKLVVWLPAPFRRAFEYDVPGQGFDWGEISSGGHMALLALHTSGSTTSAPSTEQDFIAVDMAARKVVDRLTISGDVFGNLALSNDGRLAVLGFQGGRVVVRNIARHRNLLDIRPFTTAISYLAISRDDRRLLVLGDQTPEVYDLATGKLICRQLGGTYAIFAPDGNSFAVAGFGCRVYDVKPSMPQIWRHFPAPIVIVGVDPSDQPIIASSGGIQVVDPNTLATMRQVGATTSAARGPFIGNAYWHCVPEGAGFAVVSTLGGNELCKLSGVSVAPIAIDALPDGSRIAVVDAGGNALYMYDSSGRVLWTYKANGNILVDCHFKFDGGKVIANGTNKTSVVLDTRSGSVLRAFATSYSASWFAATAHHSGYFASTDYNYVHVQNIDGDAPEVRLDGHSGRVNSVEFSPDDSRILTAGQDGTIRLWDTVTGDQLLRLGSGHGSVTSAMFDNDGKRIFAADGAGNLTVYRLGASR